MEGAIIPDYPTKIIAVTVLTSLSDEDGQHIYNQPVELKVEQFFDDAKEAEVDGVVCSPLEIKAAKKRGLFTVVPGIRPVWFSDQGDQKRVGTPKEAIEDGADLLVIGRAITKAKYPVEAVKQTVDEIFG